MPQSEKSPTRSRTYSESTRKERRNSPPPSVWDAARACGSDAQRGPHHNVRRSGSRSQSPTGQLSSGPQRNRALLALGRKSPRSPAVDPPLDGWDDRWRGVYAASRLLFVPRHYANARPLSGSRRTYGQSSIVNSRPAAVAQQRDGDVPFLRETERFRKRS